MARLLSRVECLAFDLLTTESLRLSLRQSKDTLSPGAVKDPLTRRRIASLSFGALRLEAGISDLDVEAPRTAGHYKDSATDPLEISLEPCNAPRFTRHMRRDSQAPVIPSLSRNRRREKMGPYRESTVKTPAFRIRYLAVYVKAQDCWQLVAWKSTRVPEAYTESPEDSGPPPHF